MENYVRLKYMGTTGYVWDNQNVLLESDATTGQPLAHYMNSQGYLGGLASEFRGISTFYTFDPQDSVRVLVSPAEVSLDTYLFSAFGDEIAINGGTFNPFMYIGRDGYYRDVANRMYVLARQLDAINGRWMSRDPIGFDGGDWDNLYRYVGNNPVNFLDSTGLQQIRDQRANGAMMLNSCQLQVNARYEILRQRISEISNALSGDPTGNQSFSQSIGMLSNSKLLRHLGI